MQPIRVRFDLGWWDAFRSRWHGYVERRQLRQEPSGFAIRRWMAQQPVIRPPSVRAVPVLTSCSLMTTRCGASGSDEAA
jgi:hypothetical protein